MSDDSLAVQAKHLVIVGVALSAQAEALASAAAAVS